MLAEALQAEVDDVGGEGFGELAGDVEADLGHGFADGRADFVGGGGAGGAHVQPPGHVVIQ
jgi:hypothetical protein